MLRPYFLPILKPDISVPDELLIISQIEHHDALLLHVHSKVVWALDAILQTPCDMDYNIDLYERAYI